MNDTRWHQSILQLNNCKPQRSKLRSICSTSKTSPATQIELAESVTPVKASRLSRKRPRRPCVPLRRQASADIYVGTERATPAMQIEPEVLKVSRLSRKRPRRPRVPLRRQASADIYGGSESLTPATLCAVLRGHTKCYGVVFVLSLSCCC